MKLKKFWKKEKTDLELEMDSVIEKIMKEDPTKEEYKNAAEAYKILAEAKETIERKKKISGDAIITVAAHLLGLVAIMNYEKAEVITTKAWQHITRLRL